MTPNFWKNKKILLTGHTGFKGSWISLWLQHLGAKVTGYSLSPPTNPSLFELANVSEGMNSITGDVRDLNHLMSVTAECSPDIFIHMAAQSLVVPSHETPVDTYTTNVLGTVNVLEVARFSKSIKVSIIITSDKCYENREWLWGYREHDKLGGLDPYSNSKACAELITSAYRSSYFMEPNFHHSNAAVATVRAGNVIGGGDWASNRLIPDIIKAFMMNKEVIIRNPSSIRPWQHVLEPLSGYLKLVELLWDHGNKYAEGWNFGPNENDAKPVSWVVQQLADLWGAQRHWKEMPQPYPQEANYLKLDCSKARQSLKWLPQLDLNETLKWVVEWYQGYQNNQDIRELTNKQIFQYQKLLSTQP
jgi:CDP-glucose 4,6-dehydratase